MDFLTAAILYFILLMFPFLSYVMAPSPSPVRGIYRQPGRTYIFKYLAFWLLVTLKKLGLFRGKSSGYGTKSTDKMEELDGVHELPKEYKQAVDAVFFVGVNENGFGMLASAARRHDHIVQSAFELVVPDVGVLVHPKHPDTTFRINPEDEKGQWHVDGLEITPIEVARKWLVRRSGPLLLLPIGHKGVPDPSVGHKIVNVNFEATWEATARVFDTDSDLHTHSISDAVARENWSREMFEILEKQHQTHLEQYGEAKATISIEGYGQFNPRIQVLRDHSFGRFRDWCEFHRYSISYLFCNDGSGLNLTAVSRPITMSQLRFGYRVYPDGRLRPVPRTNFDLGRQDEEAIARRGLAFEASGGGCFPLLWPEKYDVRIHDVWAAPSFYIGNDRDAQITDCFVRGTINGRPMWGIMEWMQGYHGPGSSRKVLYEIEESENSTF